MADKTMPPSDPNEMSSGNPAMGSDMAPPEPQAGQDGSVMLSIPKVAFDALHQIIMQLAQGFDQLKQGVENQAQGGAGNAPMSSEGQMPEQGMQGGMAGSSAPQSGSDEDFLNEMAKQGSQRK